MQHLLFSLDGKLFYFVASEKHPFGCFSLREYIKEGGENDSSSVPRKLLADFLGYS